MPLEGGNDALVAAVRAQERADFAHERLDRMNGSIDALKREVTAGSKETGAKLDALLIHQATQLGGEQARARWLDSRRFVIATFAVLVTALMGLTGTVIGFLIQN